MTTPHACTRESLWQAAIAQAAIAQATRDLGAWGLAIVYLDAEQWIWPADVPATRITAEHLTGPFEYEIAGHWHV